MSGSGNSLDFLSSAVLAAMLIAVSACSNEPEQTADMESAVPSPTAAAGPATTPQSATAIDPNAEERIEPAAGIPSQVRGRWGLVPADCTSQLGDAKGLMEVGADRIEFYESVAELGEVAERGPNRIRAMFAFEGEGQQWSMDMVLEAQGDGSTLLRRDFGPDAAPEPLRYQRCR